MAKDSKHEHPLVIVSEDHEVPGSDESKVEKGGGLAEALYVSPYRDRTVGPIINLVNRIENHDIGGVRKIITLHLNLINEGDENEETPLMVASRCGDLEIVNYLLSVGADVLADDEDSWTPLLNAAKYGHVEVARTLIKSGAKTEHRDMGGWTALMWAAYKGHTEMAAMLLENGAKPNVKGLYFISPLAWAAGRGHLDIVRRLVEGGARVNIIDKYGTTPLIWACRNGHDAIVEYLLAHGAPADCVGMSNWTALLMATEGKHANVVKKLLAYSVNLNARNKDGMTALMIAAKEGCVAIAADLLKKGAYINVHDQKGETPLIYASKGGHTEIVKALIDKFADVNLSDEENRTALYWAVDKNLPDIVRYLVHANANLDTQNVDGDTALMRAVRNRNLSVVDLLVTSKAKVHIADKHGDTALHISIRARSKAITESLLRNPKNSRLLYRPNKSGETPYQLDMKGHTTSVLQVIFGARFLNPQLSASMAGFDIYSNALADILSEPTLSTPITVGLYAKWGSGKSFLLSRLEDDLRAFAHQTPDPLLEMSPLVFFLILLPSLVFGLLLGFGVFCWFWGVVAGVGLFFLCHLVFAVVWFGCTRYDWDWAYDSSVFLAKRVNRFWLLLRVLFFHPPVVLDQDSSSGRNSTTKMGSRVKFIFTDYTRLTSLGGETSFTMMLATLCRAVEKEYGTLTSRLYPVVRTNQSSAVARSKSFCCVPTYFFFFLFLASLLIAVCLFCFRINLHNNKMIVGSVPGSEDKSSSEEDDDDLDDDEMSRSSIDRWPWYDTTLVTLASLLLAALLATVPKWWRLLLAVFSSPRRRILKSSSNLDSTKMEGFMQKLQSEVSLLSHFVQACDAFQGVQTRLVVIFDGLDSCDPERMLQLLDTINVLFGKPRSPFITVLAIDPHIVIRGIEQNLHPNLFTDSTINGFDYLRNIVHLPLFVQNSRFGKVKMEQQNQSKKTALNRERNKSKCAHSPAGSYVGLHRKETQMSMISIPGEDGVDRRIRRSKGIAPSAIWREDASVVSFADGEKGKSKSAANIDISKIILKHDYFSDINPRSIRRLINIVAIQARLLRAHEIEFEWHRLVSWVNVTEQWPYRLSFLIVYAEDNDAVLEDKQPLKIVYDRVVATLAANDPLLQIDRNYKKLVFTLGHSPVLTIGDMRKFLPFTINLDPYLCKHIKENQANLFVDGNQQMPFDSQPFSPGRDYNPYSKAYLSSNSAVVGGESLGQQKAALPQQGTQQPQTIATAFKQRKLNLNVNASAQNAFRPICQPIPALSVRGPTPISKGEEAFASLSAAEIAVQVSSIAGLVPELLPNYIRVLTENNVNGRVILGCDLDDLRTLLNMNFGDWQLFKAWIQRIRDSSTALNVATPIASFPGRAHLVSMSSTGITSIMESPTPLDESTRPFEPIHSTPPSSPTHMAVVSAPVTGNDGDPIGHGFFKSGFPPTSMMFDRSASYCPSVIASPVSPSLVANVVASQTSITSQEMLPSAIPAPMVVAPTSAALTLKAPSTLAPVNFAPTTSASTTSAPPSSSNSKDASRRQKPSASYEEAETLEEIEFLSGFMPMEEEEEDSPEEDEDSANHSSGVVPHLVRSVSGTSLPSLVDSRDSVPSSSRSSFRHQAPHSSPFRVFSRTEGGDALVPEKTRPDELTLSSLGARASSGHETSDSLVSDLESDDAQYKTVIHRGSGADQNSYPKMAELFSSSALVEGATIPAAEATIPAAEATKTMESGAVSTRKDDFETGGSGERADERALLINEEKAPFLRAGLLDKATAVLRTSSASSKSSSPGSASKPVSSTTKAMDTDDRETLLVSGEKEDSPYGERGSSEHWL